MKILIIGGVAGGATTAARLRRQSEDAQIILFERGKHISYANCGLPYYIGGIIDDRERLFVQTPRGFSDRFNVDVRTQSEVIAINKKNREVSVKDLSSNNVYIESYDKLVIATGAEPIKPAIKGIENNRIFSLRNIPDTDKIKSYLDQYNPKTAVVVGGGFIGLEMVENLHKKGLEVTIVERANQVLTPLDFSMATFIHEQLNSKNINMFLDENVVEFKSENNKIRVVLESEKELVTDMVILSIGVKPDVNIARRAELELGKLDGIKVNEYMQTSDAAIYALGDAVEVFNPVTNSYALIPLAGPANKQGRIVADNIVEGNTHKYKGTIGTAIAKVFDMDVATTGASSKLLNRVGIKHFTSYTHTNSHAGYYPNALPLSIKINFAEDGKLLGAQVVGYDGVDKRIDLLAQVIKQGGNIYDLQEIEHAYAPPYSSAKDPVNMAGFVAENILKKKVNIVQWNEIEEERKKGTLVIDVRTKSEYQFGHIEGAINIPVDELRTELDQLNKADKIIIYCAVGLRGSIASRILLQNNFEEVYNLSGGYKTYSTAIRRYPQKITNTNTQVNTENKYMRVKSIVIDACGLQCPGPVMKLKENYDKAGLGDIIEIKATDQAFGEDLKGWANMMGANILDIQSEKGIVTAHIEKKAKKEDNQSLGSSDGKTLVVFSDSLDRAIASFIIANGAVAAGKKVSMFFTFWGLNILKKENQPKAKKDLISRMFGMMLPANSKKLGLSKMNMGGMGSIMMRQIMKNKNVDSLESLMQQAIKNGVEIIACSMSMDIMGIKKEELIDEVNIAGVAAYLDRTDHANANLFI